MDPLWYDTAVAVDQLGIRQGAVAAIWTPGTRDLPEFCSFAPTTGTTA